jgi:hypothetical protein
MSKEAPTYARSNLAALAAIHLECLLHGNFDPPGT